MKVNWYWKYITWQLTRAYSLISSQPVMFTKLWNPVSQGHEKEPAIKEDETSSKSLRKTDEDWRILTKTDEDWRRLAKTDEDWQRWRRLKQKLWILLYFSLTDRIGTGGVDSALSNFVSLRPEHLSILTIFCWFSFKLRNVQLIMIWSKHLLLQYDNIQRKMDATLLLYCYWSGGCRGWSKINVKGQWWGFLGSVHSSTSWHFLVTILHIKPVDYKSKNGDCDDDGCLPCWQSWSLAQP